jgi:predicted ATP-binding protein involved in virulence
MLVLLYELLFLVSPDSLVMIDEPEISLHVAWQQEFLNDLSTIIDQTLFDALIATHSPQIIHDRWDLTVELAAGAAVNAPQPV